MIPVFLNPSSSSSFSRDLEEQNDQIQDHQQHLKLFISPYNFEEGRTSSLSPSPTSFDSSIVNQDQADHQTSYVVQSQYEHHDQKAVIHDFVKSSCNEDTTGEDQKSIINKSVNNNTMINNSDGSVKYWMSSKMRLIQKMSNHPDQSESPATRTMFSDTTTSDHKRAQRSEHGKLVPNSTTTTTSPKQDKTKFTFNFCHTNTTGAVRVCSDCYTTTTPLWRSGPRGPKSLCNACGIRQRKARRAMAEAAATAGAADTTTATTNLPIKTSYYNYKTHNNNCHVTKEKKSRGNHNIGHYKGRFKLKLVKTATSTSPSAKRERINSDNNKLCLRDFASFGWNGNNCSAFSGVFSQDVAEAAVLLMELSCHGFVHS